MVIRNCVYPEMTIKREARYELNRNRIRKTVMLVSAVIVSLFLSIDCFATEENRERIQKMMAEPPRNTGTNMNIDQSQYSEFCWYRISTDYEPGIAVRILPEYESELLTRLPDGTEFFVEDTDGVWGFTNMPSYSGWINLDYAEQLYMPPMYEANAWYTIDTDYEPGIAVRSIPSGDGELFTRIPDGTEFYVEEVCDVWGYTSDAMGYAGWVHLDYTSGNITSSSVISKEDAYNAVCDYLDQTLELENIYAYNGYIIETDDEGEEYVFLVRSYTDAKGKLFVDKNTGDIFESWQNPVTGEWEEKVYLYTIVG